MGTDVEAEVSALLADGAFERAATRAIEAYGPEVLGFLAHVVGNGADAEEVFSQVTEDLWRGLPTFAGRCSVRTWLYVLARHAVARFRRAPWNHRGRRTGDDRLDALVAHARTRTQPWLRTEVKDRWRALREALSDEDRAILVLRVDRALPWRDVARVTLDDEAPDDATLQREVERLNKRFTTLKRELRERARAAGLLDDDSDGQPS